MTHSNHNVCRSCKAPGVKVSDSRPNADGDRYRRRRCGVCGYAWSTIEVDMVQIDRLKLAAKIIANAASTIESLKLPEF